MLTVCLKCLYACAQETPYFPVNDEFIFVNDVPEEDRVRGDLPPAKKEDCEVRLCSHYCSSLFCFKAFYMSVVFGLLLWTMALN